MNAAAVVGRLFGGEPARGGYVKDSATMHAIPGSSSARVLGRSRGEMSSTRGLQLDLTSCSSCGDLVSSSLVYLTLLTFILSNNAQ